MKRSPKRVWLFVVPRAELLDVSGPWEVLGHTNDVLRRTAYELELIGPSSPTVATLHGLQLTGVRPLPRRTTRLPDVAIVAGGSLFDPLPAPEASVAAWLRRHHQQVPRLVSICTGAFVLGEAGVLDGRRATTHWKFLNALRSRFPAAHVVDEGIFLRDGQVWTSAGVTAGIDLTLAMVEQDHGHDVAMAVAKRLVLFLRRSGNQAQFSEALQRQSKETSRLRDITAFVLEHLDEPLSVERVAEAAGTSVRTLTRWCQDELDESPAALVRRLRVEEARRLLEDSALPLKDISARTGLGDASTLWRVFTQLVGTTPAAYRERFAMNVR